MSDAKQNQPDPTPVSERGLFFSLFKNSRAAILLATMFLQILLAPIENTFSILPLIMREFIILAAIFVVSNNKRHLRVALLIGVPALIMLVVDHMAEVSGLSYLALAMVLILYLYVIRLILTQVFRSPVVTVNTIAMALCCYMLIGQMWMLFYAPLAARDPQAFSQTIIQAGTDAGLTLTYFSYVTLTTLGYGDISPISPMARSLAILEALTGTLFLAVLISRLVGTYRSQADQELEGIIRKASQKAREE